MFDNFLRVHSIASFLPYQPRVQFLQEPYKKIPRDRKLHHNAPFYLIFGCLFDTTLIRVHKETIISSKLGVGNWRDKLYIGP